MEDIRLPETKFEFQGKEYILRCNFNVLAEIQEVNGGLIPDITNTKRTLKNFLLILSCMMNEYADEQGWTEKYTPKQLGRILTIPDAKIMAEIMNIFVKGAYTKNSSKKEAEKN